MKVLFTGDFSSDNGPGMANKMLRAGLKSNKDAIFLKCSNQYTRLLEIFVKLFFVKSVCLCSATFENKFVIFFAKVMHKKIFYIMHGFFEKEFELNDVSNQDPNKEKYLNYEDYIFRKVDKIFCVSKSFMNYMKQEKPLFSDKFDYSFNGIDISYFNSMLSKINTGKRNKNQILSIGGGMPQKNNLAVCEAISFLNTHKGFNLKYVIIGKPYSDKDFIIKYDFVEYYDYLPHDEVIRCMQESNLYVQNSTFETFGIAPVEAVLSGCQVLLSSKIGALDIFNNVEESQVIFDTNDYLEISEKIERLIIDKNKRVIESNIDKICHLNTAQTLWRKINNF